MQPVDARLIMQRDTIHHIAEVSFLLEYKLFICLFLLQDSIRCKKYDPLCLMEAKSVQFKEVSQNKNYTCSPKILGRHKIFNCMTLADPPA